MFCLKHVLFTAIAGVIAYNNNKLKKEASQVKPIVNDFVAQERSQDVEEQVAMLPPRQGS